MEQVIVKVKRLPHCRALPKYATVGSAGMDLTAAIEEPFTLFPGKRDRMPTGLMVEIPEGYEGQVRPRSGLADRAGISLTNCVGTIDCDYRGEVVLLVINLGDEPYTFEPGERVAQLIISPVPRVEIKEVEELTSSYQRGTRGFGSTGRVSWASDYRGQP